MSCIAPATSGRRQVLRVLHSGLTFRDIERLFTRDTPEAYRFFSRHIDVEGLRRLPWYRRTLMHARLFFPAFTLADARASRDHGVAPVATVIGLIEPSRASTCSWSRIPPSRPGPSGCSSGFCS